MRGLSGYYFFGLAVLLLAIAGAELIWVPAPIRTKNGMQWIEMIDLLYYAAAIIPLSWAAGAFKGLRTRTGKSGINRLLKAVRLFIIVLSVTGAYMILAQPDKLLLLLLSIVLAAVLVLADMLLSEALVRASLNEGHAAEKQGRKNTIWKPQAIPKRSLLVIIILAVLLAALLWPTGYRVTYPGMTLNLNRYAHVEGGHAGGMVNGILVFERPAVPADWLYARLLPMYEFEKIPEDEPPLSETYTQVVAMKADANGVAAAIAMQKAGTGSGIIADGVKVVGVLQDRPADGQLHAGDIIVKLNDLEVSTAEELMSYMSSESVSPGDSVAVTLKRQDSTLVVDVPTAASSGAGTPNRAVFGISVQTEWLLDIPLGIQYERYMAHIGGPSHGAMLTLAFIDQLTPGGVTYGNRVAGTGTIEADGTVGLIGGIKQKAYAVSRTDADVFFVPAALETQARGAAPELNVVPVGTIDDVLEWLAQHKKE